MRKEELIKLIIDEIYNEELNINTIEYANGIVDLLGENILSDKKILKYQLKVIGDTLINVSKKIK